MMLNKLWARLVVATLTPVILVSMALYPLIRTQLSETLKSMHAAAETRLEAEYDILLRSINESFNQLLATTEFPMLQRYLGWQGSKPSPAQELAAQRDKEQLIELLQTLQTHFSRYTRLALIDSRGHKRLSVTSAGRRSLPQLEDQRDTMAFQEVMALQYRDLYVSPPYLRAIDTEEGELETVMIDIATPVFDAQGERFGMLLFTLDWQHITTHLPQATARGHTQALLVDANGNELLPRLLQGSEFGQSLATSWPAAWQAMTTRGYGRASVEDKLLWYRPHDLRTHHYHSRAGMIVSQPETQPWRLGLVQPKPTIHGLLTENPGQLLVIALVYLLSIALSVYWTLGHHRLRALRQHSLALSHQAQQYASEVQDLYENAPCGYHSLDIDGRVIKINSTELDWLGYRADEVIAKRHYREFVTPESRAAFDAAFRKVQNLGEGSTECELLSRDGSRLPVAIQATAQVTDEGFQYSRATVFDLSERKKLEARLAQQALTDPLTGLGNRRYLEQQAAMEIARAQRSGEPLSLIAVDLDHFKRINDTYGHDAGDLVLQAFANTARQQLRDGDVLCRMGGEEFAVLLPSTTREQAMQVAERLRLATAHSPDRRG